MYMLIGTLFDPLLAIPALLIGYYLSGKARLVIGAIFMLCAVIAGPMAGQTTAADRVINSIIAAAVLIGVGAFTAFATGRSRRAGQKEG